MQNEIKFSWFLGKFYGTLLLSEAVLSIIWTFQDTERNKIQF